MARQARFNSSRVHLRRVNSEFAASVTPDMFVLDAGAGEQPYRDLFSHARYEAADFEKVDKPYAKSTYVCDLAAIPVEDARFDRIVFNQVLEHIPEPIAVLRELRRVTKPGGQIICTCPLFYGEHEQPYDYYRYTQFAHRHLFATAGWRIERLEWMEGYFGTLSYQFRMMSRAIPLTPVPGAPVLATILGWPLQLVVRLVAGPLSLAFGLLDLFARETRSGMPKNYVVVATAV
jgi:SAM-dependent methyltransferase